MNDKPHVLVRDEDGIIICTLDRPEKLNALSAESLGTLWDAVLRLREEDRLKVMLINATGRYFCAGGDLRPDEDTDKPSSHPSGRSIRKGLRLMRRGQILLDEMEHVEKPIVVSHHAPCVGGGLEVSLSCDFRFAGESASYLLPEGQFGVLPGSNGVSRLTRYCGAHWARWLVMAGKPVSAQMALNMGLVHQVYPDETLEEEVMEFCRHLARQNGEQMGAAKIAIELCAEVGRDSARHIERMSNSALMLNPDYQAGMAQYVKNIGGKK